MISNLTNNNIYNADFQNKLPKVNINNFNSQSCYYAKKGEAIYKKDMDLDEDGIITFDEFKDYCMENDISQSEIESMLKNWVVYHTSKKIEEKSKEIQKEQKEDIQSDEDEIIYSKKGDGKYDIRMDLNDDDKVTYKEYMEYCRKNAIEPKEKTKNIIQKNENENNEIINVTQAIDEYCSFEQKTPKSKIEKNI